MMAIVVFYKIYFQPKMNLTSIQKVKAVLFLNFIALFILIISTPYFIREGFYIFEESFVEGVFLAVEIFALFFMFKHYDLIMEKKEYENLMLNLKLRKKERELLNAFQYLGKVNVQVSMIKSVFENIKTPSTKQELKSTYKELLRLVCSAAGEKCAGLRIVDLVTGRTLGDFLENGLTSDNFVCSNFPFGNKDLIETYKNGSRKSYKGFQFFYSGAENFKVKAFIFIPAKKSRGYEKEEREFLEMIANQCEIFYLLYTFQAARK
jgi:hypothetical protein